MKKTSNLAAFALAGVLACAPALMANTQKELPKKSEPSTHAMTTKTTTSSTVKTEKTADASQKALEKEAKISMHRAKRIALKKEPGKVTKSEIERDNGKLVYSFDIRQKKGDIMEVNVDAMNGKVLLAERESASKEKAEMHHARKSGTENMKQAHNEMSMHSSTGKKH